MEMNLFFAPDIVPPEYTLPEEESNHCTRVLRLGRGDTLHIADGRGGLYRCEVTDDNSRRTRVRVVETCSQWEPLPYRLTLAVAPTKQSERFEWLLEKATEVGVQTVVPLMSARCQRSGLKTERARRVMVAAMKQSLKAYLPHLDEPASVDQLLARPLQGLRLIAHCGAARSAQGKRFLPELLRAGGELTIMIGPEGDFTPEEVDAALARGFQEITLGNQRLRTETAALAAVVMVAAANPPQQGGTANSGREE